MLQLSRIKSGTNHPLPVTELTTDFGLASVILTPSNLNKRCQIIHLLPSILTNSSSFLTPALSRYFSTSQAAMYNFQFHLQAFFKDLVHAFSIRPRLSNNLSVEVLWIRLRDNSHYLKPWKTQANRKTSSMIQILFVNISTFPILIRIKA